MVATGKDLVVVFRQRNFNQDLAFVAAEHNTDGFVFFGEFHKAVIVIDIHPYSTYVLMRRLTNFYIDHNKAAIHAIS